MPPPFRSSMLPITAWRACVWAPRQSLLNTVSSSAKLTTRTPHQCTRRSDCKGRQWLHRPSPGETEGIIAVATQTLIQKGNTRQHSKNVTFAEMSQLIKCSTKTTRRGQWKILNAVRIEVTRIAQVSIRICDDGSAHDDDDEDVADKYLDDNDKV